MILKEIEKMDAFTVWGQIRGRELLSLSLCCSQSGHNLEKRKIKARKYTYNIHRWFFLLKDKDLSVMPRLCGGPPFPSVWHFPRAVLIPGSLLHHHSVIFHVLFLCFRKSFPTKWKLICAYHIRLPWILKETFVRYLEDTRHIITAW